MGLRQFIVKSIFIISIKMNIICLSINWIVLGKVYFVMFPLLIFFVHFDAFLCLKSIPSKKQLIL